MTDIAELTKEQLYLGFQSGTSPEGKKWPALKNPRPPHRNQNNKPLLDTYRLMESVVNNSGDHLEAVTDQGLKLGTYVEYAGVHQRGSGNIPARPFMGFSKRVKDEAMESVADSVINQIDIL